MKVQDNAVEIPGLKKKKEKFQKKDLLLLICIVL